MSDTPDLARMREEIARLIDPKAWELRDVEPSIPKHKNRNPEALDWERYRELGCAPSLAKADAILAAQSPLLDRIAELEGERESLNASNEDYREAYVDRHDRAVSAEAERDAAEAQVSALQAQVDGLQRASIEAIALLDVAISGTVFTKPNAGRVIVNVARAQAVLDGLRAALSQPPADEAAKEDDK